MDESRQHPQPASSAEASAATAPHGTILLAQLLNEKAGDRIGRYKLLQKIGEGGMGSVWMAEQLEPVRRQVALKLIKPGMDSGQVLARFEAERQALALMDHPNIARVLDAGATPNGRPFFAMELVKGTPLTRFCDEQRLSIRERLELFVPVCQAVQHAHQKGIIHRDLKPGNVLVALYDGKPVPKVIDFGVAKAAGARLTERTLFTEFGAVVGTLEYMSPEQAELNQLDIDTRSDIYSLGVLLYELLTGTTPLTREVLGQGALHEILRWIREEEPPKPSTRLSESKVQLPAISAQRKLEPEKLRKVVRGDLDWIAMKALEKDRARRYETANGLAKDIQRHLADEPVIARPPSTLYRFQKAARRHKLAFAAGGAVALSLVVGLGASSWLFLREKQARQRAVAAEKTQGLLRIQAETAASKSRQVAKFLEDMLTSVGPSVAKGRDTALLREILEQTAQRLGKDLTNQPEVEAELRSIIGYVYTALGEYAKAEDMDREALEIRRKHLSQDAPDIAGALNNLAIVLRKQGKLAQAETADREVLVIARKLFGSEHRNVATSLNNLAVVLSYEGQFAEAEAMHRQALAMRRKVLGNEHSELAQSLNNLANVLGDEGKLAEAETMARAALAMKRKLLGDMDPEVAISLNDLGCALRDESKLAEAEAVIGEALAMQWRLYGDEHPDIANSLNNLAAVVREQGKLAQAETMDRQALAMRRKLLGNGHQDVAGSLSDLSLTLLAEKGFTEAELLARECLAMREKGIPDGWQTCKARCLLGASLLGQQKYTEAEPLLLSGYEGMKQREDRIPAYEKGHLMRVLEHLAQLYEATNRPDKAADWRRKLEEFQR